MNGLTLESLLELEMQGWDALCSSTGGDFYGRVMTPEGLMLLVNGMVLDRATITATLNEAPAWRSYTLTEEKLIPIGADAAALVYRAVAVRDGEEPFEALMASTYILERGDLRLALYQQTTVTH